ncbi:hypothetical protein DP116_28325 [Brasilonema bromeliae SPC951]|uniref:Uncharacterized protein n=2 Tax=Bromeliae group (in: Brasilonema) TaxID=3398495 RepID=A0ABX1PF26_9CYAN|nr:hypothetical protein [Brasilonema bromeliae SPC951]
MQAQSPGQLQGQPMQQGGVPTAQTPGQPGVGTGFTPQMATQFVTVWLQRAMDYNMQTCQTSHKEAFDWMTPNTVQAFRQGYWTPDIEQAVMSGKVSAAFQPISVQATYMNPDGGIIVAMTGSLVMQSAGTSPATQPLAADFLVKQDNGNVRVVGINIHPTAQQGSPY